MNTIRSQFTLSKLLPLAPAVFLALMGFQRRWVAEDAFISLRVVQNILDGHGPVYNIGERVEVYTHPLWLAIITLWGLLGLPIAQGAAYLGLFFAVAGLLMAQAGALRLNCYLNPPDQAKERRLLVPLGAIVFVAIPVVWDFATSGLETGLTFAWMGGSFWLLTSTCTAPPGTRRTSAAMAAVLIGLGPLVRPDLALFSAGFLITLLVCRFPVRAWWKPVALAALIPFAYQVFRMGYFAALVANTAIAKEASRANWLQGLIYLLDFTVPYVLVIPFVLLSGLWLAKIRHSIEGRDRTGSLLLGAPIASAALHALYTVRVGGDFMHGRFFLPALFGFLLPLAVIHIPLGMPAFRQRKNAWVIVSLTFAWVLVCALWLRPLQGSSIAKSGIADERAFYVELSEHPHPLTVDNHRRVINEYLEDMHQIDAHTVTLENIGATGMAFGSRITVIDMYGIASPIGSRMRVSERGRPGHEKLMPDAWAQARLEAQAAATSVGSNPAAEAAASALQCGDLERLRQAISDPLTPRRFITNVALSWHLTQLRIDPNPVVARNEFCKTAGPSQG